VASGYWPLVRYNPMLRTAGGNPFLLDSPRPRIALTDYTQRELRYRTLSNTDPAEAEAAADDAAAEPSPRRYLSLLERAAAAVDVPIIGSLNGVTAGGWTSYARAMQDAGAAAIELNIYYIPGDPRISGRDVEQRHIDILCGVKTAVTVPVAVKLSPHFSSTGEMALRLDQAGADGLVLFNRFLQPDIDPESMAVLPIVDLSSTREARLPRTWISILRHQLRASLAATTGVDEPSDVVKYLLAGADVVMTASALIRYGPEHAAVLLDGLSEWMARKGYASVGEVRGLLAVPADADQAAYERAGYVRALRHANTAQDPL
jgi:dihydroorotate dehydrogenase (fumarate)